MRAEIEKARGNASFHDPGETTLLSAGFLRKAAETHMISLSEQNRFEIEKRMKKLRKPIRNL